MKKGRRISSSDSNRSYRSLGRFMSMQLSILKPIEYLEKITDMINKEKLTGLNKVKVINHKVKELLTVIYDNEVLWIGTKDEVIEFKKLDISGMLGLFICKINEIDIKSKVNSKKNEII